MKLLRRPPDAPALTPDGKRTSNGLVWASKESDFFTLEDGTVLSRSMIEKGTTTQISDGICEEVEPSPDPGPDLLHPWNVLKHASGVECISPATVKEAASDSDLLSSPGRTSSDQNREPNSTSSEDQGKMTANVLESVTVDAENSKADASNPDNATPADGTSPLDADCEKNTDSIPKLEDFIPKEYFPDVLLVNDPKNLTNCRAGLASPVVDAAPKIYKRVFPKSDASTEIDTFFVTDPISSRVSIAPDSNVRTAHLNLKSATPLGHGSHSRVYRSFLKLPDAVVSTEVSVAAKLSFRDWEACQMLINEAKIYDAFPSHLMEDWSGFNFLPADLGHDIEEFVVPCTAVVPKFYGFYVPVGQTKNQKVGTRRIGPSAILLIEECGTPIEPYQLEEAMRDKCYSLPFRLHKENFIQNSCYARNILKQPGPLTLPPSLRSNESPSFRLIDFGRAQFWKFLNEETEADPGKALEWDRNIDHEKGEARDSIYGKSRRVSVEEEKTPTKYNYRRPWAGKHRTVCGEGWQAY